MPLRTAMELDQGATPAQLPAVGTAVLDDEDVDLVEEVVRVDEVEGGTGTFPPVIAFFAAISYLEFAILLVRF